MWMCYRFSDNGEEKQQVLQCNPQENEIQARDELNVKIWQRKFSITAVGIQGESR